ncbi:MAG: O-antigen ligase family protein [Bacteroidetes bacterium]|nr:O-antigen ligase family protein [Bacteroidota bacterium]
MKTLQKFQYYLALAFVFTSFVTYTPVFEIFKPFHSKILLSRLFGFPLLLLTTYLYTRQSNEIKELPKLFRAAFIFIILLSVSSVFSLAPYVSFRQVISTGFLLAMSICIYEAFKNKSSTLFLRCAVLLLLLVSVIGIGNLIISNLDLNPWLGYARKDAATSLLSRFHEAGNFALPLLLVTIAVWWSNQSPFPEKWSWLTPLTVFTGMFFLMASGRVSTILGFVGGLTCYFLWNRDGASLKNIAKIAFVFILHIGLFFVFFRPVFDRFAYRFQSRIFERQAGTQEADFVVDNLENTFRAFSLHPITGTGLGAHQIFYSRYGLHGTYLQLLGEAGLLGFVGLLILIGSMLLSLYKFSQHTNESETQWLHNFFPLFGGLLISWLYNNALYNPTFWFLITLLALAIYFKKQSKKEKFVAS